MDYINYNYAFNPSFTIEKESYFRNIRLLSTIYDVLCYYNVSSKCKGYMFIVDAICIIYDMKRLDVCLEKEVYRLIAKKYGAGGIYIVEQSIRYALKSVDRSKLLMTKITNKAFLIMAVCEVSERMHKEC